MPPSDSRVKRGAELRPGDLIVNEARHPAPLSAGEIELVTNTDFGVQIRLVGGQTFIRPTEHWFEIADEGEPEYSGSDDPSPDPDWMNP